MEKKIRLGTCRGNGGYGMVYFAYNEVDNRNVAIKFLFKDKTCNFYGGIRELDILNKLSHPNIVDIYSINFDTKVYDNHQIEQIYGLVDPIYNLDKISYEFEVAKMNLHKFLNYNVSYETKKYCFLQICLAINYLHKNNIIHGDIKPENILCFQSEGTIKVKLCDFGLSLPFTYQEKFFSSIYTCYYRPPEICTHVNNLFTFDNINDQNQDGRFQGSDLGENQRQSLSILDDSSTFHTHLTKKSDIWALGTLFYEIITGKVLINNFSENYSFSNDDNETDFVIHNCIKKITSLPICEYYKLFFHEDEIITQTHNDIINFFSKMIVYNPSKRYNIDEILGHYYFDEYDFYINQDIQNHIETFTYNVKIQKPIKCLERSIMFNYLNQIFRESIQDVRTSPPQREHDSLYQSRTSEEFSEEEQTNKKFYLPTWNLPTSNTPDSSGRDKHVTSSSTNEVLTPRKNTRDFLRVLKKVVSKERIYFHSSQLINRYLNYKLISEKDISIDLYSKVCIIVYIYYKYFNMTSEILPFNELFNLEYQDSDYINSCFSFEEYIIKYVCELNIYQSTLYEYADSKKIILDETQKLKIKKFYNDYESLDEFEIIQKHYSGSFNNISLSELFNILFPDLSNKPTCHQVDLESRNGPVDFGRSMYQSDGLPDSEINISFLSDKNSCREILFTSSGDKEETNSLNVF